MRNLFLALATIFIYSTASAQNTIQEIIKKVENVKVVYKLDNAGGGEFDFQNTYKELVFYGYTKNGGGTMMLALQVDAKNNQAYKEMFDLCHKYLLVAFEQKNNSRSFEWILGKARFHFA